MKFVKKLFVTLLILFLVSTLALYLFIKSLKPEFIKNYVSTQLSALTHQKSRINGSISWQVFPHPGIKITEVQIGEENSGENYSIKLNNLLFNLKISPLLRGNLVFGELNVDGFNVTIYPESLSTTHSKKPLNSFQSDMRHKAGQFAIERFLLSRGTITIVQKQRKIIMSGLQIGAKQFNLQQELFPLQFKTSIEILASGEKFLKAYINFSGSTSLPPSLPSAPLLASLQNILLNGQLALQDIQVNKLKINKISTHVKTKTGILSLDPLTVNLYNGESVGDLKYEFANKKLNLNQTATNINGGKLLSDLVNKSLLQGSVDFSIHTQSNLENNFSGNGSLTIKDGIIESFNIDEIISETSSEIAKLLNDKRPNQEKMLALSQFIFNLAKFNNPVFSTGTNFKVFTLQYMLQGSEIQSNSIVLQTNRLQLKGTAKVDLHNYKLQSQLNVQVALNDNEVSKIQQLLGGSFPILVTGTLNSPIILPDVKQMTPILAKAWLKEALSKPVKKINKAGEITQILDELSHPGDFNAEKRPKHSPETVDKNDNYLLSEHLKILQNSLNNSY